ncbi:Swt1 family HEPN domain-containing protein [Ectopseudomonas hydrolytica]|uniref:Swt1 family HEPN domain-containing protein n=1 Tax=Ectopseudomonas hydrolytica TaxID=2493633 RepID=UPI0020B6B89F|nr:Swt1 family HEPN domain-containing protein [Pseudomonas hydrolytica]UTH30089.1 Swt1 family HEPN domain-containing protein [Pseudomonas hydrolytica]UZZ09100.1 Swt1 family HEPN domain-containing protein [Pseudomonas mendocina]
MNNLEEKIKVFAISNQMAERALDQLENKFRIDLGRNALTEKKSDKDEAYYPQFDHDIRAQARDMAVHYELFYCLEVSIRSLVREKLKAELGSAWWDKSEIPDGVRKNARENMQRDIDSGFTQRSDHEIDYTTFGELAEIVRKNWQHFVDIFNSEKAFNRVMHSLNLLRGPIAHCSPLAEDEVVRLRLTMKDWFRLME